jgi:DNA-binding CsgD family transcriptional regulator
MSTAIDVTTTADTVDNILATWVDGEARARLVVDSNLIVYWVSSSAEAFLRKEQAVLYRNGRLRSRDPRMEQALRAFVAEATDSLTSQCITNRDTGEHVVLTAVRLQAPWRHVIGLTLHQTGADLGVRLADLHQAFGLTPSERSIARHLLDGMTADETAAELGISLDTVRTHIKRAYAKLGVGSREAFFHKLAPFVLAS